MYTRQEGKPGAFDSVVAVEGKFVFRPDVDKVPSLDLVMCYLNSGTRTTYGTCPFTTVSPKTIEAFLSFLKSAEQDFGEVIFEGGVVAPFGEVAAPTGGAETGKGLPSGLGEG